MTTRIVSFWARGLWIGALALALTLAACGGEGGLPFLPPTAPPLDAPEFLAAVPGEDFVDLTWTRVESATAYSLYFDVVPGVTPETGEAILGLVDVAYRHDGLDPGQTYYYVVAGQDERGEGPPSEEIAARVPDLPVEITVGPPLLTAAIEGRPWVDALSASGGVAPYHFDVLEGPSWILLDGAGGVLWGRTPLEVGDALVLVVAATDTAGARGEARIVLPIERPAPALPPIVLAEGASASSDRFKTVEACASCHSNAVNADAMRDASNRPVAPVDLWLPTLMADSMRDPYHRAVLRAELEALPDIAALIEDTCLTCHAPMAAYELHQEGESIALEVVYGNNAASLLALDGNSCTTCHQIVDDGLGERFDGDLLFTDDRLIWAPHDSPFGMPMLGSSGYTPEEGDQISESAMCAVCHTLRVPSFAVDGTPLGTYFPEQTPYFEWQNSSFTTEGEVPGALAASCGDCHVPRRDDDGVAIVTDIARRPDGGDFPPLAPREPYGRHLMLGGNAAILTMLRDQAADLHPRASSGALTAAIAQTREQLRERTADLSVKLLHRADDLLAFDVVVDNKIGHKFPTSFPTRRAWLRVVLEDEDEQIVFASGRVDETGTLVDMQGFVLPIEAVGGGVEPHHDVIRDSDDVQIWEAVAHDVEGHPTYHLLFAQDWLKDNRLLPLGWSEDHPRYAEIEPHGVHGDADFVGGSDIVHFRLRDLPEGPLHLHVALLYQPIGARSIYELIAHDELLEVNAFRQYWESSDREPELVDEVKLAIP